MWQEALVGSARADSTQRTGYRACLSCFRALFTYEGNSNDIRVAGTGGEYDHMRKQMGSWRHQEAGDGEGG